MVKTDKRALDLEKLIDIAVDIRERGNALKAGGILTEVIRDSYDNCFDITCARALGERIVCSKHLYQNEGLEIYLNQMEVDIQKGWQLNVGPEDKAVFFLRFGDVHASRGQHDEAEKQYWLAYDHVRKGGKEEAEYSGHIAEALVNDQNADDQKKDQAKGLIDRAFKIIDRVPQAEIDIKHRLIILSGLHGRMAKVALSSKNYLLAFGSLWRCWEMSRELAHKYNYPQRLKQFWLRARGKGV